MNIRRFMLVTAVAALMGLAVPGTALAVTGGDSTASPSSGRIQSATPAKPDPKNPSHVSAPNSGSPSNTSTSTSITTSERAVIGFVYTYWWNSVDQQYEVIDIYPCAAYKQSYPAQPVDYVSNLCNRRFWLAENANNSGWKLCINPNSNYYVPSSRRWPFYVEVGAAKRC